MIESVSIIHPSRSRPQKSFETAEKWLNLNWMEMSEVQFIASVDSDDPFLGDYKRIYNTLLLINDNKSSIEAINNAARFARGNLLMVVSDDTVCDQDWIISLLRETNNKHDFILKTQDGIQPYIITMPIMDRAYYNRTGYIYHPDFKHLFCDTYLTCVADITGRKITSSLIFKHDHYSVNGTEPDELHKRNDATWKQGEETFIRLMKEFTPEERSRIQDPGMKNWLRNHGVR